MDTKITRRDTTAAIHTAIVFPDGRDFELVTFYKFDREPKIEVHSRIFSMETSHDGGTRKGVLHFPKGILAFQGYFKTNPVPELAPFIEGHLEAVRAVQQALSIG